MNKCRKNTLEIFCRLPHSLSPELLKPFIMDLLTISLKIMQEDNEDNSLIALRVFFDIHKSFRSSLENQVQVKIYINILLLNIISIIFAIFTFYLAIP